MAEWDRAGAVQPQNLEEFVVFLEKLRGSLKTNPEIWAHDSLDGFLEAWAAFLVDTRDSPRGPYRVGSGEPTWEHLAWMLLCAQVYE
ncbi:DUF7660 family protein [Nakamurella alba]